MARPAAVNAGSVQATTRSRWREFLAAERTPRLAVLLATLLAAPSLRLGLMTDDETFRYLVQVGIHPFKLFSLDHATLPRVMASGQVSWWTTPDASLRFFRPLSSAVHFFEYSHWPDAGWFMHASNVVLYIAMVWIAARTYRTLFSDRAVAGLAALLFAIDDAHAQSVGWIASRNTVSASLCALLAVSTHIQARSRQPARLPLASLGWLVVGLLCGESTVAALAYLAAYAFVYESGPMLARVRSIAPQLVLFALWAVVYVGGSFGARALSFYRGFDEPALLLSDGLADLPLMLESLLGVSLVSATGPLPPTATRLVAALIALPLLVGIARCSSWSKPVRFCALGSALSLPPLFTTLPQDRILFMAGFGAFAVIADVVCAAGRGVGARVLSGTLVLNHGLLAPLLFVPMLGAVRPVGVASWQLSDHLVNTPGHSHVLLNGPFELLSTYAQARYFNTHGGAPAPLHLLYVGQDALVMQRPDANTLEIAAARGWGRIPFERIFTARSHMPARGERRELGGMLIEVRESDAQGLPTRVRFQFPTPLDAPERHWLVWQGTQAVPWTPPAVGQQVEVPALDFFKSVPR